MTGQYWIVTQTELDALRSRGFDLPVDHFFQKNGKTFFVFPNRRVKKFPILVGTHVELPLDVYASMKQKPRNVGYMQTFRNGTPTSPRKVLLQDRRQKQAGKVSSPLRRRRPR